jgi:DNA-binding MarR family transcriptional regulator
MRRLFGRRPINPAMGDLTLSQLRVLRHVMQVPDSTMGELSSSLGVGLSAATGLVDRLVHHGLVRRAPDRKDRRVIRLRLTAEGVRTRDNFRRERQRRLNAVLRHLTDEERAAVATALAALRRAGEAAEPEDGVEAS